jgi:pimeloyl-ACP methyl ester carboxylesterase
MAQDQVEVMAALGFKRFMAAGHDRGARVLHRMCLDHPEKVERAAILDIVPQHHLFNHVTQAWATSSYHWFFMIQPEPMPERLMSAEPISSITKLSKTAQGLEFLRQGGAGGIQTLLPEPGHRTRHVRGLSRHRHRRSGDGHRGFRRRTKDRLSRADPVGRDRCGRAAAQARGNLEGLCDQHRRRQGAALRALPVGRGAGRNLRRTAGVF